uniref:PPPDE domain-containing protein n=1 Tax=Leersia perrieri TaxID=77586 RepID=A0A0D9WML3_9ORYZ
MAPSSSSSSPSTAAASTPRAPKQHPPRGASASSAAAAGSPVYLNVYDVTPANGYSRWLGLGVYHSGVQGMYAPLLNFKNFHGVEYAYGAHEGAASGIFEVAPRRCPGYAFREAVMVGTTAMTRAEVRALMADLAADFPGDAYNLVSRNCNHFCDAACRRLVAGRARIPRWVNRLAKIGVVFTCVIPGSGNAVRRPAGAGAGGGGIRSRSARQAADAAAAPRAKTFFRSLSVGGGDGGGGKNVAPRLLSTSPSPTMAAPAMTSSAAT